MKLRDDFFRGRFADGARGIPDAALRQSILATAGAVVGVEPAQGDLFLPEGEFREVDAGKLGGSIGVLQKNFALVFKGFDSGGDGHAEQRANFRLEESEIPKTDMLLNDAAFRIHEERSGQGGDTAVFLADLVRSHGDGIVDAGFVDIFLNLGGVFVVDVEADDQEAPFITLLQSDEVRNFGATRSTPSGPEIQEDNFAARVGESERFAVEGTEVEVGGGIGVAHKAHHGLIVLLRCGYGGQEQKQQRCDELASKRHGAPNRRAH